MISQLDDIVYPNPPGKTAPSHHVWGNCQVYVL